MRPSTTTLSQAYFLRDELHGRLEARETIAGIARMVAAAALLAGVAYGWWWAADEALGDGLVAQTISVTTALAAGLVVYAAAVLLQRVPEAVYIQSVVKRRLYSR